MKPPPANLRHGLETPHPCQPTQGYFRLVGWALLIDAAAPTQCRLVVGEKNFAPEEIIDRPDVAAEFPDQPHARRSGFRFLCYLPFGLHTGRLEASADGIEWLPVRTLAMPVSSHPLLGAVEKPAPGTVIESPARVEGWCFHPEFEIASVRLRFGNIEVPCDYALERTDVAGRFPRETAAARSGFITSGNLPRGEGHLRLRAVTTCGRTYFLPSELTVDIAEGEDPPPAPLAATRSATALPPRLATVPSAPFRRPPTGPRNILFALYGDFTSNSALHVAALTNELIARGYDCVVAVRSHKETITALPRARFMAIEFDELENLADFFVDHRGPSLLHAWTTRETVRRFAERTHALFDVPIFIHLEDNERELLENVTGLTEPELLALDPADLDARVPIDLSHPRRAAAFLARAAGVTTIVDRLRDFVPGEIPTLTFWPAADASIYRARPRDDALRASLGIGASDVVLFYHGNVHRSNAGEVGGLYEAVAELNASGCRTFLIRTGRDAAGLLERADAAIGSFLLHLGHVPRARFLPELMALADYFVQPGLPGAFNDYRFPSKLPEFFALGRPVILPQTNLGSVVRHGVDAWVLPRADGTAIADAVSTLHGNPALRARLSAGALDFSAEHFSWKRSAESLLDFYQAHSALRLSN